MSLMLIPAQERYFEGLYQALDEVARERCYLALFQAPPKEDARAFMRDIVARQLCQVLAVEDGQVLGWCDVLPRYGEACAHVGVLGMGLVPSARGRGIGRQLLAAAVEQAVARGLCRIELSVRTDNHRAIALYERFGFVVEGRHRQGYSVEQTYVDTLSMAWLAPQAMPTTASPLQTDARGKDGVAPMQVLAISGSLRAQSINTALLRAARRLAPRGMAIELFTGLGELPIFNPDRETALPASVQAFRVRVAASAALLIASPEYAHGISGAIKNGLDWLVGDKAFAYKPVALLNTSPRSEHADAALREVLQTMAASLVEPASVTIPLLGAGLDEESMVNTPAVVATVRAALGHLQAHLTRPREAGPLSRERLPA